MIEATIDVHAGALDQPQRSLVLKLATLGCCLLRADLRPVDSDLLLELRRSYLTLRTLTCCMSHSGSYLQSQHILTFCCSSVVSQSHPVPVPPASHDVALTFPLSSTSSSSLDPSVYYTQLDSPVDTRKDPHIPSCPTNLR